jgi:ribonucleoside-diphosphate reductase alpha chain
MNQIKEVMELVCAPKYLQTGESFKEGMSRIADTLKDDDEHFKVCQEILLDQRFLPAGRIQASIGAARITTAFNCFVSETIPDSMRGITEALGNAAETMRLGGGDGFDFSTLRPKKARIKSLDSFSSGPISFMNMWDAMCETIKSAGHRRGAMMGVLRVDHPDIEEFITCKQKPGFLTNFNISVAITDKFMEAVKNDEMFDLVFEGRVYKTVKATYLWNKIMRNTWDHAEPGVIFIDRMNQMNNLWYCETIAATNPLT